MADNGDGPIKVPESKIRYSYYPPRNIPKRTFANKSNTTRSLLKGLSTKLRLELRVWVMTWRNGCEKELAVT
eukprot:3250050-Rhodomonas_salina.2